VPQTFGRVALVGDTAFIPRPHCRQYVKEAATIRYTDALIQYNQLTLKSAADQREPLSLTTTLYPVSSSNRSQFSYGTAREEVLWKKSIQ